jgi:serine protease
MQGMQTHVAGTIAQSTNNNYGTGIAYEASLLMPAKSQPVAARCRYRRSDPPAADNKAAMSQHESGGAGESQLMEARHQLCPLQRRHFIITVAGNLTKTPPPTPPAGPR